MSEINGLQQNSNLSCRSGLCLSLKRFYKAETHLYRWVSFLYRYHGLSKNYVLDYLQIGACPELNWLIIQYFYFHDGCNTECSLFGQLCFFSFKMIVNG